MRRLTGSGARDEKGAIVVLMAAFTVVIVGVAALVVDVGALHDEKRQLQNGADAAALGVPSSSDRHAPAARRPAPPSPWPLGPRSWRTGTPGTPPPRSTPSRRTTRPGP